jgi:hypothetical protein
MQRQREVVLVQYHEGVPREREAIQVQTQDAIEVQQH